MRGCPACKSPFCRRVGGPTPCGPTAFVHQEDARPATRPFEGVEKAELDHIRRMVLAHFGERSFIFATPDDFSMMKVAYYTCDHTMAEHKASTSGGLRCAQKVVAEGRTYNTLKAAITAAVEYQTA